MECGGSVCVNIQLSSIIASCYYTINISHWFHQCTKILERGRVDTKLTKQVNSYTNVPTVVIVFLYYYMKQIFDNFGEMMKMELIYIVTEDAVYS